MKFLATLMLVLASVAYVGCSPERQSQEDPKNTPAVQVSQEDPKNTPAVQVKYGDKICGEYWQKNMRDCVMNGCYETFIGSGRDRRLDIDTASKIAMRPNSAMSQCRHTCIKLGVLDQPGTCGPMGRRLKKELMDEIIPITKESKRETTKRCKIENSDTPVSLRRDSVKECLKEANNIKDGSYMKRARKEMWYFYEK